MKPIAICTDDPAFLYDVGMRLRTRNIPYVQLSPAAALPETTGVVLTRVEEAHAIAFPRLVVAASRDGTELDRAIIESMEYLTGTHDTAVRVIGIDPGERPGIALLADERVISTAVADSPEAAAEHVGTLVETARSAGYVRHHQIKIGHGAKTLRNRIIRGLRRFREAHDLSAADLSIAIVDEAHTTVVQDTRDDAFDDQVQWVKHAHQKHDLLNVRAAISIARSVEEQIYPLDRCTVKPTDGEIRDIQRRSRIQSNGAVTISRALALQVGSGALSLDDAIQQQRECRRSGWRSVD